MKKILIVDDSALMRRQLSAIFTEAGGFDIRVARNGSEAVQENRDFKPDVVTLDINMPGMDGITALSLMMMERPVPVVMVSSLTEKGALATFEALNLGAVDYIAKPGGTISLSIVDIKSELLAKVNAALKARVRPSRSSPGTLLNKLRQERKAAISTPAGSSDGLVLIGVSTGGPRTLEEILPNLPADFAWPVLVAQHMPAAFTRSFAERLDAVCALRVVEASAPTVIEAGHIYLGKGGADMVVVRRGSKKMVIPKPESPQHLWHPSVELLARSALEHYRAENLIAVLLTGMGYDGAEAMSEIHQQGGKTIAESEESAVVFGMPAELIARSGASMVLPASKIAKQIVYWSKS